MTEEEKNRPFSPFVHAEERRLHYAQTISSHRQGELPFISSAALRTCLLTYTLLE
jgi:hypothetical protein